MKAIRYIRNRLAQAKLRILAQDGNMNGKTTEAEDPHPSVKAANEKAVLHWEHMLMERNDILARRKAKREDRRQE